MEGIAVAALQEVRLFKPELSLAEKAIQNIKIWAHFDPKDPGSGVATLINTQLATVEDYKDDRPIYTDNGGRLLGYYFADYPGESSGPNLLYFYGA
ncbi:uncharacterized protein CPUR_06981 [Claviceps purpurea 20.1]|uniref:Uncharacterized protein n=1 Tax=Claviceps purpurea (strain 20.1) TaxID=1111077 RepID=M1WEU6_CLAP2|nr:uncharacterized protein CPUR_06981 [Claviceps purpurea 20.1]